jgi:hypothetical protein
MPSPRSPPGRHSASYLCRVRADGVGFVATWIWSGQSIRLRDTSLCGWLKALGGPVITLKAFGLLPCESDRQD